MARLVPTVLIIASTSFSGAAIAADRPDSPWSTREKSPLSRSFEIADNRDASQPGRADGARIIAGRQIMPNGIIGFGFFGPKPAASLVAPVTIGERAIRKQRRAAVGLSLRF